MNLRRICPYILILFALMGVTSTALASPWTAPPDELILSFSQDFQYANSEFLPDGTAQIFPLNGAYRAHTTRIGARYGFTENFEGGADVNIAMVSYRADPLILDDFALGATSSEATQAIRNFNSSEFGAADFYFHGRYNLVRSTLVVTMGTTLKLPTGYELPTGTFVTGPDGESRPGGQATLGDGQTDLTQSLLVGTYIPPTRTFMRLDAGLRYRFGSPGHQALASFRAGQFVGDSFVLAAGVSWLQTITEGEVIGQTFVAIDPERPADEYDTDNIRSLDLRLDRDALSLDAGLLISIGEVEFVANYGHTLRGTNTAAIHAFSIGAIFAFPDATNR